MNLLKTIIFLLILNLFACESKTEFIPFFRYEEGLNESKLKNKPIFLHFTCYGCVGYDEFERDLIKSEKIKNYLNKNFVSIQLFVDDRAKIDRKDSLFILNYDWRDSSLAKLSNYKNKGQINFKIESSNFHFSTQPLYVILSPEEKVLVEPFGYIKKDISKFLEKLELGLKVFENQKT